MLSKYLATLGILALVLTLAASRLTFATRSQVLRGTPVEDTFNLEFTVDADSSDMYNINPALQKALEKGITFATDGALHVDSSTVELTPKTVSWSSNHTNYTAPGAAMTAQVKWEALQNAPNGAHGLIYLVFPELPGLQSRGGTVRSGSHQMDDQGREVLREATAYQSPFFVSLGRFGMALAAGLPFAVLLHCIFWAFVLKKEKRSRREALPPQTSQLPRTFYPNPIAEWQIWTVFLGIFAVVGCLLAGFCVADGFMSTLMVSFAYGFLSVGLVIGLVAAYFTGKYLLTITVRPDGMSYARGRADLEWQNVSWSDVSSFSEKSRTYRGNTRYWLEFAFKDGRKRLKINQDILDYAALRSLLFSMFKTAS
jgi:hypothetical protein